MNNREEYIICAAVWFDDGIERAHQPINIKTGLVVCGRRHHNCFMTMGTLVGLVKDRNEIGLQEKEQGFVTSFDRFVTREEAAEIALKQDQFANDDERTEVQKSNYLYSENIY